MEDQNYLKSLAATENGSKPFHYKVILRLQPNVCYGDIERDVNELMKRLSASRFKHYIRTKYPTQEYAYTHASVLEGSHASENLHVHMIVWMPDELVRNASPEKLRLQYEEDMRELQAISQRFSHKRIAELKTEFRDQDAEGNPRPNSILANYLNKQSTSALRDGFDCSRNDRWIGGRYVRGTESGCKVGTPPERTRYHYKKRVDHRWVDIFPQEPFSWKEVRDQNLIPFN